MRNLFSRWSRARQSGRWQSGRWRWGGLAGGLLLQVIGSSLQAAPDLWIRDDAADTGAEPNVLSPVLYLSDDIWVRRVADPNYDPTPFPSGSPTWTPLPHQGPCYRDPKASSPNYMYIRIRNRGDTTSSGTETLHAYWAKASTGLSWPTDWVDHLDNPCPGPDRLYGYEITKPRKSGVAATVAERNAYVDAIQQIDTASFQFPDLSTYFDKQNEVHSTLFFTGIHSSLRFLPWHRELMARYEALLREVHPELTLLYWDWTTDPSPTIVGPGGFMGASSGVVGAPFASFGINRSKPAGAPGAFGLSAGYESGTLLTSANYASFWGNIEVSSHNSAHNYLGGIVASVNAASDPMFFMLHANCDRLWALWQRQNVSRWAPATAYDASQANAAITSNLRPWDGTDAISPWINTNFPADPEGYAISKPPTHHSIVYPPIYDDALLTIPPIPAGHCAIIEIPFYPPPAVECGGFSDPQHLCLLARIEPITSAPPEGAGLWNNVKNHNNIAWRNVSVSDCNTGPFFLLAPGRIGAAGELIRNARDDTARVTLRFREANVAFRSLFDFGIVRLRLDQELLEAWERGGREGQGIEFDGQDVLLFQSDATLEGLILEPRQVGRMDLALELDRDYQHPEGDVYAIDVLQFDDRNGEEEPIGGQRYELDFNVLDIVQKGSDWEYLDGGERPDEGWTRLGDRQEFRLGSAPFAYARPGVATRLRGERRGPTTCYFRRVFEVPDPQFYRNLTLDLPVDDGVVVYLNGEEILRARMPNVDIVHETPARSSIEGAAARACVPFDMSNFLPALRTGRNVLAVEVHPAGQGEFLDISFDLGFGANVPALPRQPPVVVIQSPLDGTLVPQPDVLRILADVVDADGNLSDVRILFDGELVFRGVQRPFEAFVEAPRPGRHRVSVLALDETRLSTRTESVITIAENVPPAVEITLAHDTMFPPGEPVRLTAVAGDVDGEVVEVTYLVGDIDESHYPDRLLEVGTVAAAPWELVVDLPPGPYYVFARATDDDGATGHSTLLPHIHVHGDAGGEVRPGDCNQDGRLDIADAVCMFGVLFLGSRQVFPCGDGSLLEPLNVELLDWNGDGGFDISDGVAELIYQFGGGPPHGLGTECREFAGCDGRGCP